MGLTKPNQLQHDLKAAAFAIEDAAYELFRIAKRYGDAELLVALEKIEKLHGQADQLKAYADEVKASVITWAKGNG